MPREAFLFYVDDWLSSGHIELMDAIEERGYLRLLLRAWKEEDCGLPIDALKLAAWSKMGTQWFRETADRNLRTAGLTSGEKVLKCFTERDGRLFNERQLKEWEYQQKVLTARRESGKHGGRPRKPNGFQMDNQTETIRFRDEKQNETNLVSSLGLGLGLRVQSLKPEEKKNLQAEWEHGDLFRDAWDRHKKYRRDQPLELVAQLLIGRNGTLDWIKLESNNPPFCEYWDRRDWSMCGLTLLEWIDAGMPLPPPEPAAPKTAAQARLERIANRE